MSGYVKCFQRKVFQLLINKEKTKRYKLDIKLDLTGRLDHSYKIWNKDSDCYDIFSMKNVTIILLPKERTKQEKTIISKLNALFE